MKSLKKKINSGNNALLLFFPSSWCTLNPRTIILIFYMILRTIYAYLYVFYIINTIYYYNKLCFDNIITFVLINIALRISYIMSKTIISNSIRPTVISDISKEGVLGVWTSRQIFFFTLILKQYTYKQPNNFFKYINLLNITPSPPKK